ncbi:MAG: FtsX-like permease family protein, partial [Anaerolineales bacterium]
MYILFLVLAIPSLIAMVNTLAIGVIERTREIGMLRAVGATQGQVRRMVIVEAVLLAGLGTALGLISGVYLGYVLTLALSNFGFALVYQFPGTAVMIAIAIGLLIGIVAAVFPARQAARLEIVRALRYE